MLECTLKCKICMPGVGVPVQFYCNPEITEDTCSMISSFKSRTMVYYVLGVQIAMFFNFFKYVCNNLF